MIREQLGFILSHSGHPQGSKRISLSIRKKCNTMSCEGSSRKDCAGRKDVEISVPPAKNTPKKGQAKEEQGNWGNLSPE
jgi:hypothetical protein